MNRASLTTEERELVKRVKLDREALIAELRALDPQVKDPLMRQDYVRILSELDTWDTASLWGLLRHKGQFVWQPRQLSREEIVKLYRLFGYSQADAEQVVARTAEGCHRASWQAPSGAPSQRLSQPE